MWLRIYFCTSPIQIVFAHGFRLLMDVDANTSKSNFMAAVLRLTSRQPLIEATENGFYIIIML
jgi:hypothetical protein